MEDVSCCCMENTKYCNDGYAMVPKVGFKAPDFSGQAVMPNMEFGTIKLADFSGRWLVMFFYPLDFTFVCPTEIIAFSDAAERFDKLNARVVGVSVDSHYSHFNWMKAKRSKGGIGSINIPLLSDMNKKISQDYGALYLDSGHSLRATYIIDPQGVLRHITFNDLPIGRSMDETVRLVEALQQADKHGEVCPMNWKKGGASINVNRPEEYFEAQHPDKSEC